MKKGNIVFNILEFIKNSHQFIFFFLLIFRIENKNDKRTNHAFSSFTGIHSQSLFITTIVSLVFDKLFDSRKKKSECPKSVNAFTSYGESMLSSDS